MQNHTTKILWVDDEIELLKPHILFLENKGYEVTTATNGIDAVDLVESNSYDIIFLDEQMPGLSGLDTLAKIKKINTITPVVMITKSEEETIMDEAIGAKMSDYLIKPVNPKQILLAIKKNVDRKDLITKQTNSAYQSDFMKIGGEINDSMNYDDWQNVYRKLVYWELELSHSGDKNMDEILQMQKRDANKSFARFIRQNYLSWMRPDSPERPLLSPDLFKKRIFPILDEKKKVFVLVIDNLRYDQWIAIRPILNDYYSVVSDEIYTSILPTATMYARNSIFAGLMPLEIKKMYPQYWLDDDNKEDGKNNFEENLLLLQMERFRRKEKLYFEKISNLKQDRKPVDNFNKMLNADLSVMVLNVVDMISHARTEMDMIKELVGNEAAYRSITESWFKHSNIIELLGKLRDNNFELVLTTDHGTIKVANPQKVVGERTTNSNLRYKLGRNLGYKAKDFFEIKHPEEALLPNPNVSTAYIFAENKDFIVYPNEFNYYANFYRDTFQHGGVSLEEMLIPLIRLHPR